MAGPIRTTRYFDEEVRVRRPYLRDAWLVEALTHPEFTEIQANGRIRHWLFIPELERYIRVVTLEDGRTIHTAFPDRGFKAPER
jgi:hypothetical protein